MIEYLPSPLDLPPVHGIDPRTQHELSRRPAVDEPFSALGFKVMSDPYVGKLTYFRVYSGQLNAGTACSTPPAARPSASAASSRREPPRGARADRPERSPPRSASRTRRRARRSPPRPRRSGSSRWTSQPVIAVAIEPKTKGDQDKLGAGLQRLSEEDPTFRVRTDNETGQTLISGMGELHLEIIVDRLTREFNGRRERRPPQVAYRETVGKPVEKIEGKFVRQTGGRGQYGHAVINLEPTEPGEGYEFVDKIVGGKIPRSTSLGRPRHPGGDGVGHLAGYPVVDIRSSWSTARITTSTPARSHSRSPARWRSRAGSARSRSCWSP